MRVEFSTFEPEDLDKENENGNINTQNNCVFFLVFILLYVIFKFYNKRKCPPFTLVRVNCHLNQYFPLLDQRGLLMAILDLNSETLILISVLQRSNTNDFGAFIFNPRKYKKLYLDTLTQSQDGIPYYHISFNTNYLICRNAEFSHFFK